MILNDSLHNYVQNIVSLLLTGNKNRFKILETLVFITKLKRINLENSLPIWRNPVISDDIYYTNAIEDEI